MRKSFLLAWAAIPALLAFIFSGSASAQCPPLGPGCGGGGGASGIANNVTPANGFAANSLIGASGNVVTSLPSANNALLATNSSGVAAYATTLNNGFTFAPPINTTGLTVFGYSLTGANAQALEGLSGQWNTTGNPTAFSLSIIDTADGGSAYLMNLLGGTSGTTSEFKVSTAGMATAVALAASGGSLTLGSSGTLGSAAFGNATSGTITLQPPTGALGTVTVTLPDATANLDYLIGSATGGHCVELSGTAGGLADAGSGCVSGPGSSTSNDLASWNGAGGSTLADSGIAAANVSLAIAPATANDTQIYAMWPGVNVVAGTVAPAQSFARCAPFTVYPAQHWDELLMDVTTLGTGPLTVALYSDAIDPTTKKHQPESPISSGSGSFTVTGIGVVTVALGTAGTGIPIPAGLNWLCTNDATNSDAVRFFALPSNAAIASALVGAAIAADVLSSTQISSLVVAETSGTWPSFVGTTFTENTGASIPFIGYRPASVP